MRKRNKPYKKPVDNKTYGGGVIVEEYSSGKSCSSGTPLRESFRITLQGDYAAKGIGLRNRGFGIIDFTGEIPRDSTIVKAFLYWAVIQGCEETPKASGKINGNIIRGTLIANPLDPFRNTGVINIFRSDVTPFVQKGVNALYDFPSGVTNSTPPDISPPIPPMLEGASLVIIYKNPSFPSKTVIINDGGKTIYVPDIIITTSFFNLYSEVEKIKARTTYIVADGQRRFEGDKALFNNAEVAGPGSKIKPSDAFDGSDGSHILGYYLDGMWDTLTVEVDSLIGSLDNSASAAVYVKEDSLTYIAQILSITSRAGEKEFEPAAV